MSNRKGLLLAIAIIIMGMFITAGSYAFWSWASGTNKTVAYNTAKNLQNYIIYEVGNSQFSGQFKAVNSYTDGMSSTIMISKTSEAANVNLMAIIHMDINQIGDLMKSSPALKWVVTQGNQILGQGNFVGANSGDTLDLVNNIEVTTTPTAYTIWIWLDKNAHPSSALSGETLDTNVWTEITQTAGTEDRFEITRINANYQNISATVVDSKHKVTHYAVVTSGNTPNTWTSIGTASNIYNLNTTVNAAGTYDVYFKDQNNRTTHKSVTVDAVDTTAPSCTFGSFTPVQVSNNEIATIELTCTDNESDITVNNLTTSDITKSNNSINITNISKTAITNGYKYTITVTGTETDGDTTLTLAVNKIRNAVSLGNAAVTSSAITVANQYTISFATGNNNCTLNQTTYATKTPTYGDIVNIPAPSCTGYTFAGWTANSGLDTTNAKYGDTNNPTTTWSSTATPVTATYFKDIAKKDTKTVTLTATWTANTYTVRFNDLIPNDYQMVEYIESTGTQYIDTGVIPTNLTVMQFSFRSLAVTGDVILGYSPNDTDDYRFFNYNSKIYFDFPSGKRIYGSTCNVGTDYNFEFGNYYVKNLNNGSTLISGTSSEPFVGKDTITINKYNNSYSQTRVYSLKIYENGIIIRDFVPVYRKSDNAVGLYDIVNNIFYNNAGTGTFNKGQNVENIISSKNQAFTYGVSQSLDENTFTKTGYTFNKWNTKADGTGVAYNDKQIVSNLTSENNGVFNLYAQWQRNSHTVQVVVNHGTGSTSRQALHGSTETFTINNSTGYSNPTVTCTNGQTAAISGNTLTVSLITNDTVCTITYAVNTYTVRFNYLGYQPVEYIQGTGTQYIDTGYYPNSKTSVYVDYQFTALTQQQRIFGADNNTASADISYSIYINSSNKLAYAHQNGKGNWVSTGVNVDNNRHTISFGKQSAPILIDDGSTYSSTVSGSLTKTSSYPMAIMATNSVGSFANKSQIKIYDFKIYENNIELIHFIPAYRATDEVRGLLDIDNEIFYPNAGGTVEKGADLHSQSFTYGISQRLDENTYERSGYTFNGWNTSLDGTGTSYTDHQLVENLTTEDNGIVDLYAKWLTNDYNIQFISSNELCTLMGSAYANATVGYTADINVPNPTCAGFDFTGWTSYTISTGAKSGTTANPTTPWVGTSTQNTYFKNLASRPNATVTMIANWTKTDNTAPTLTVGTSESGTTYTKSKTATITLSDNVMFGSGTYTIKYGWSTSALTCADMTNTTTITTVTGETSKAVQVTINTGTGAGRLYVCNPDAISDRVGNTLAADTVVNTQMYLDNTGPTGTMTLETNGGVKTTLTLTDVSGIGSTYYYLIDTSPITCNDETTGYNNGDSNTYTFTVYSTGLYYVCAKVEDSLGNAAYFTGSIVVKAYLKTLSGTNDAFKDATYKTNITDIYFVDNVSIPNDAVATYDLDDTNVGLIKGWIIDNPNETGKYKLYIGSVDPIYGRNLQSLFSEMTSVRSIDFNNFDTSEATSMYSMFYNCSSLASLDLSNFDTSNVTTMRSMFNGCSSLASVDLSSFDTSNVETMQYMFQYCSSLASLDLSNFDTSNVTTMHGMFGYCSSLISLDLRSFNTSKVTNMQSMFIRCTNLAKVDLSSFDASKVSPATSMFHTCSNLLVIYASPNIWNLRTNITSPGMFTSSTNLAGGNCTLQSSSYVTATRAVIDAPGTAGYLTAPPSSNMLEHGTKGAATAPFLSTNILKNEIKKITFTNSISGHTPNGTDTWDVSYQKNGSVLAWVGTADENGRYEMTIGQNGGVVASNGYYLFSYLTNLASFDGMQYFDTSNVVNMRYMFDGDTSLTSIDLSHFDTLSVKSMTAMFRNCSSLTSLDLSHFNTSNTLHMTSMFDGDSSLTSLNLSSFNTSKVTTMKTMFQNCSNLHSINLSNFDTSNVTDMQAMFAGCSGFAELNLSNFNTSKVTTMQSMFSGCQNLTNLNVKSFNTANVTTMSSMFASCNKLETIDLSSFDTSNVKLMEAVFRYDSNLLAIYVSSDKWSTASVTSSVQMFGSCSSLSGGNGTIFNSSYVTAVRAVVDAPGTAGYLTEKPTSNMLQHGTKGANTTNFLSTNILKNQIKKITFTNSISGHTPNGTDTWDVSLDKNGSVLAWVGGPDGNGRYEMTIGQNGGVVASNGYGLFSYLNNLTAIDGMEYFDTSNVANMYLMFDGDSSLTTINLSNFSTVKATMMRAMFRNCSSLTTLNLSNFDTSKVTNMGAMFDGNTSLTTLNISSFNTSNVTAMDYMFQNCSSLTSISFGNNFDTSKVTTMTYMFKGCSNLTTINLSNFNTANVTTMAQMFESCSNLTTLDLSSFNTSKVTTMDSMFNGCNSLTNLNVTSFNTSQVTTMRAMFQNCRNLTKLDVSSFNTANVTNMVSMFQGCSALTSLDLSNFNTAKVTTMNAMFYGNSALIYINLSGFNTANVTVTANMFFNDSKLQAIYVSSTEPWDMTKNTNSGDMFGGLAVIVGGNGTAYNSSYKNKSRAVIDTDATPGYLTAVPTSNVLEPGSVNGNTANFLSTSIVKNKIKKITFTNSISGHTPNGTDTWDVSFQKNGSVLAWVGTADGNGMYEMTIGQTGGVKALNGYGLFSYLNNLTAIDGMQYFDVSDVTLMRSMFQGDTSLTTLDLSSWDTSKVKLMNNMFNGCSSLTTIYASSLWDTSNLSNSATMFTGATNLPNFNSSVVDATNAHTGTGGYLTYKAYP